MNKNKAKTTCILSGRAPIHPVTLSFGSKELQQGFAKYHVQRSLKLMRFALIMGMLLYILYSFLDRIIVPDSASTIFIIRIGECLLFLAAFFISFTNLLKENYQLIISLLVFVAGLGIIGMIVISGLVGGIYYYAGLIMVIIYAHGILQLRFVYASLTTWIVVIIYEIYMFAFSSMPSILMINNSFFLISANLLGMFSSYGVEFYMRTVFWQNRVLNERNKQVRAEHKRKTRELHAARQLQLAMLPQQVPEHPDIDLFVSMKTATEIGGDYYDFHVAEDGTFTFALGDATGHGAQAGAMVTATKFLFSNYASNKDVVEFLSIASKSLSHMRLPKLYMALAIGKIKHNILELSGTGLPPAFLFRANNRTFEEIPLKGIPLGAYGGGSYQKKAINLSAGDSLILMTDGFPEQINDVGEELGYDKVKEIFSKVAQQSPVEIIGHFNKIAASWVNGNPQRDDMTFLAIKRKVPVFENEAHAKMKRLNAKALCSL